MARYNIPNMYIANKMRDASDAALTARVSALETNVTTLETMSTTERVVGKWIDGRNVYEKVVSLGTLPDKNSKEVDHGIADADIFVEIKGIINNTSGTSIVSAPLPFTASPNNANNTEAITLVVDGDKVRVGTGEDRSAFSGYAILRYVKVVAPSNNETTKKGGKN